MRSGDRPGLQIVRFRATLVLSTTWKGVKEAKSVKNGMDSRESSMRVQWIRKDHNRRGKMKNPGY